MLNNMPNKARGTSKKMVENLCSKSLKRTQNDDLSTVRDKMPKESLLRLTRRSLGRLVVEKKLISNRETVQLICLRMTGK